MNIQFWLIILSAIIPAIVLLVYILIRDRKRPEPFSQIAKGFWYGCLSVVIVLIFGGVLQKLGLLVSDTSSVGNAIKHAFLAAAFPEEAAKMYMLWLLLRKNPFFDEHMDGIVLLFALEWVSQPQKTYYIYSLILTIGRLSLLVVLFWLFRDIISLLLSWGIFMHWPISSLNTDIVGQWHIYYRYYCMACMILF
ncbi:MAG: PrsW family glutamic-type intramembrane protease [Paludibacteraceae bacterium]|nr:PrsW family glutamic-type intramembrane protease [Paludibacteraceae bacterium]